MKSLRSTGCAAIAAFGLAMSAFADGRILTVDPDPTSSAQYHTLQSACSAAQDGDTIQCAAGVYDSGSARSDDTAWAYRRALLKGKSNVKIVGAGRDLSIVQGAGTAIGGDSVCGIQLLNCSNIEISGFTFRGCYTTGSDADRVRSQGSGVVSQGGSGNFVVDCSFVDCVAVQGGAIAGFCADADLTPNGSGEISAVRCFFSNCWSHPNTDAHVAWNANLYYCVIARTYNPNHGAVRACTLVNCTFGNARFHHFMSLSAAYNTLFARSTFRLGASKSSDSVYRCIESDKKSDAEATDSDECLFEKSDFHFYNMIADDYRLVSTSVAAGYGNPDYLANIPEAYRTTDFYGKTVDPAGAINVGAAASAESVVTPTANAVRFIATSGDSKIVVNGATNTFNSSYMDANSVSIYVFGDYPSFMRVKVITTSGNEDFGFVGSSADYLFRYPEADGDYVFLPPPLAIANSLTLTHKVCPTANELYVDDDSAAANPDGTQGNEFPTIQAAIDAVPASGYGIIHVAAGTYADGGAALADGDITSRVCVKGNRRIRLLGAGADRTFIVGAAATEPDAYGCGADAVRCVGVAADSQSQISGVTLTGGRSATAGDAMYGAVAYAKAQLNVEDCVISNNVSTGKFILGADANYRVIFRRSQIVGNMAVKGGVWSQYTVVASSLWANNLLGEVPASPTWILGGYNGDDYGYFFDSTIYAPACANASGTMTYQGFIGWPQSDDVKNKVQFRNTVIVGSGRTTGLTATGCVIEKRIPGTSAQTTVNGTAVGAVEGLDIVKFADAANGDFRLRSDSAGVTTADWSDAAANSKGYAYLTRSLDGVWPDLSGETKMASGCYRKMQQVVQPGDGFESDKTVLDEGETATLTFVGKFPPKAFVVDGEEQPVPDDFTVAYTRPADSLGATLVVAALKDTEWYVDAENGTDTGHGTADAPLAKLSDACTGAVSGDTIHVAPGRYAAGEMTQTEVYWSGGYGETKGRVLVKSGVTVASTGSAADTFIVGLAAQDGNEYGLGAGAVRCAIVQAGGKLKGFTLTDGRTNTDYNDNGTAAGVIGAETARIEDCVITNCWGYMAGGNCGCTLVRCRIVDCLATGNGPAGRNGRYINCYIDHNRGTWTTEAAKQLDSCTIGNDNWNLAGKSRDCDVNRFAGTEINNLLFLGNNFTLGPQDVTFRGCSLTQNAVVPYPGYTSKATFDANCIARVPVSSLDADGRPILGVCPAIDKGDASAYDVATMGDEDLDGNPRFQNGNRLDIGCCEADWKPAYSKALGRGVTVTAADASVELTDDGVTLPAGAKLSLTVATPKNEGMIVAATLAGGGALSLAKDGGTPVEVSESGKTLVAGGAASMTLDFSVGDIGSAILSHLRHDLGGRLFIR